MLDLGSFITKCKEEGDEIIICLDANEETEIHNENAKEGTLTHLKHKSTMVCAHEFLGYKSGTFETSGRQLDYVLVTPGILPAILRGGYRPYTEGITSDHKSLFIDFEAGILFGDNTGDIDISRTRNLNTKYPTRTEKYVSDVRQTFEARGIFRALKKIETTLHQVGKWTSKLERKYNNPDGQVTQIMLKCER